MNLKRTIRYQWVKFKRLQGDPRKLAWGMALGVFIGVTPTVPFHTVGALVLAPLLRISPVTAYLGIWVMNPITMGPIYLAAYKVGQFLLFRGEPLTLPATFDLPSLLQLLWRGGLALQVGGLIMAIPPAIVSYFLTLWAVQRYRQHKARKAAGVFPFPENHSAPSGPEA
ncbi:MAG: DUF2062 domain-containing protein [Deltaproteobacteria bacterium]|nr:DUF2062 domain-containing protein [Deltaproteobacteria bacterium]MBI4795704.1 DUF2062 domain-containing protein [Deltaproteobacteria bacterium]